MPVSRSGPELLLNSRPELFYQQSAAIPYRWKGNELEVLLITSRRRQRWIVPKGIKEPELTAWDSAAQEAWEEAGVVGTVSSELAGVYEYEKWGGVCRVEVFPLAVEKLLDEWPESFRERQWVSLATAIERVREESLKEILRGFPDRLRAPLG